MSQVIHPQPSTGFGSFLLSELNSIFIHNLNQWTIVFTIMLVELLLCTLIVLPLPAFFRTKLLSGLAHLWHQKTRFRIACKTLLFITFYLMCDNIRVLYISHAAAIHSPEMVNVSGVETKEINLELFKAQRNVFLCGFTLFFFGLLYRFQSMAHTAVELERSISAKPVPEPIIRKQPAPRPVPEATGEIDAGLREDTRIVDVEDRKER